MKTPAPATNSSASSTSAAVAEPRDDALLDCLVIGAGPAGLTAATYLARYRRDIAVVDGGKSRARWIPTSHNCPGFPFGVGGEEILARYRRQAAQFGVEVIDGCIARLQCSGEGDARVFTATAADGRHWRARNIILATGVIDNMPAMDGLEQGIAGHAVRLCAICDGYEASDAAIAVLAPVDEAVRHAAFLRTFSRSVTAIASDDTPPSTECAALAADAGIVLLPPPDAMCCDDDGCVVTCGEQAHRFDTLYPVLGSQAQSQLATALGALGDDNHELAIDADAQTTVAGLYAIGDVASTLNQISVGVGQAALAATHVHNRLPRNLRETQDGG
ncbi:MAG: NAD(P)/FAD-dependent oxidoreductase [Pseudoxanthomonas suwonensis]|nr:NAD(P)/FAD-dependent oxidoreductase [Pseudoxanthomonas suwonensis]